MRKCTSSAQTLLYQAQMHYNFFLEDLSYRFLILYVSEREFVIEFWRSVVRGSCARALCSRSVLPISNYAGILLEVVLGARFWLSGSTT